MATNEEISSVSEIPKNAGVIKLQGEEEAHIESIQSPQGGGEGEGEGQVDAVETKKAEVEEADPPEEKKEDTIEEKQDPIDVDEVKKDKPVEEFRRCKVAPLVDEQPFTTHVAVDEEANEPLQNHEDHVELLHQTAALQLN